MKILIACEESQRTTMEFRRLGHEAYSCDIQNCSGGHPEYHIKGDALRLINGRCYFRTCDGKRHRISGKWDLIIAHPPCTYLTSCGNGWFNEERYGSRAVKRKANRLEAAEFFMQFVNADCDKIAIENPVGWMNSHYRKPDQIIQPYQFGEPYAKKTCFWLKGLPNLIPTEIIPMDKVNKTSGKGNWFDCPKDGIPRAKWRSKTFLGISRAIAEQWV